MRGIVLIIAVVFNYPSVGRTASEVLCTALPANSDPGNPSSYPFRESAGEYRTRSILRTNLPSAMPHDQQTNPATIHRAAHRSNSPAANIRGQTKHPLPQPAPPETITAGRKRAPAPPADNPRTRRPRAAAGAAARRPPDSPVPPPPGLRAPARARAHLCGGPADRQRERGVEGDMRACVGGT